MTPPEIKTKLQSSVATLDQRVELAFLPGQRLAINYHPENVGWPQVIHALTSLGRFEAAWRDELQERMYAFYLKQIEHGDGDFATAQDQLDWEAKHAKDFIYPVAATCATEIWPLVRFESVWVKSMRADGRITVEIWGRAAWDGEHGIVLYFLDGERLHLVEGHGHAI